MRKVSSEMCVSKGSQALLSGAQKHLIEITFKLRKRNSDDSSHTPQEATRFEKVRNEKFSSDRSTESKAQKHPHISACVCRCVSHHLRCLSALSLFTFLSRKREGTARTKPFGRARDKSKTSGTLGGGVPHSTKRNN